MSEKIPTRKETIPPLNKPLESANYEGDFGELFLARIQNPVIKKQIVLLVQESGDKTTSANVQRKINRGIQVAKKYPELVPGTRPANTAKIYVDWVSPIGRPLTPHELSMVAAHEKGHHVRLSLYNGEWFQEYFVRGFDTSKIEFTDTDYRFFMQENMGDAPPEMKAQYTPEVARQAFIESLFSTHEIVERMAQLKNYFGMAGNEEFTKAHLDWAREHYLKDLPGCDNGMTQFFQAITAATQERFIYLINNSGI